MLTESIVDYEPVLDDIVIWSKLFTTWYGKVVDFDKKNYKLHIVFEGSPFLLATLNEYEYDRNKYIIDLTDIKNSRSGTWAVIRYDFKQLKDIWYV